MNLKEVRARAAKTKWSSHIEILVSAPGVAGQLEYAVVPDGSICSPTMQLSCEAAQELMDTLWQCGLRPTEGAGSAGALRATQRHLEDMRAFAFAKSKVQAPK